MRSVMLVTGTNMASVGNEAFKIQNAFHRNGNPCHIYYFNLHSPRNTAVGRYDLAIWWTPFLPHFILRQQGWLNWDKCALAVSYYTIEGLVTGIGGCKNWLGWQYVTAVSNFTKSVIEMMGIRVKEVIPHEIIPNPVIDHGYGKAWRAKFPAGKKVLLYNGSQINRKALPKLRQAINDLSQHRSDFIMVFHTDNVKQSFHTPVSELQGVNTVVECEFPHIGMEKALAKMLYADVIVHPAVVEGFGLPVLEALNLGKPLVCVNAYGVNEIASPDNSFIVTDVVDGWLEWKGYIKFKASWYDPSALAHQIELALDAPASLVEDKRVKGLDTAKKFYNTYDRFVRF